MKCDVVIIGAGPAGLFAAAKLADHLNVIIIDKGRGIDERKCISLQNGNCKKCSPCNITGGLGGAGGLSDGKLNLRPDIGGNLEEFVGSKEAWHIIDEIDKFFLSHGAPEEIYAPNREDIEGILRKSAASGIKFIPIVQRHMGSDKTPAIISSIKEEIESKGARFLLQTNAISIIGDKSIEGVLIKERNGKESIIKCKYVIAAPGRVGAYWLSDELKKLNIRIKDNPVDIGVRVEVPDVLMDPVTKIEWDPKFHINTPTYDDFVRTFCTCPKGFIVEEVYDGFVGVNGHSTRNKVSSNTNFAFLVRVELTEPTENTSAYAFSIASIANILGSGRPIIQRLGDLKRGRRSTWERILKSNVSPTFQNAVPGDIAMALPNRLAIDIIEGLEALNNVIPGVASPSTILYAPEIKLYAMKAEINNSLETPVKGLYVAGDGAGVSRGIVGAAATGIIVANSIMKKIV